MKCGNGFLRRASFPIGLCREIKHLQLHAEKPSQYKGTLHHFYDCCVNYRFGYISFCYYYVFFSKWEGLLGFALSAG